MQIPILIVGGGPAGVCAALALARQSIDVRLIEQSPQASPGSRAKGVQPRTLEMFEALGVLDEVLASGGPFPRWRSYRAGKVAWEKSIYQLLGIGEPVPDPAVPYPQTWMIPQWRTEEILRRELSRRGVEVEYGSALTALDQDDDGVTATIHRAGDTERVRAAYVIAADGAASAARKLLGVAFDGITRDAERFVIADVRTADLDRTYWHNWSDPADPAARVSICPLPATDMFQYVAPLLPGEPAPELTLATVQRLFDERSEGVVARFSDSPWIILHRTNERLASRFRIGRVFLVGDAAHAIPAAGGQGMNTAVQDSHNLAWKLAAVLRGAPDDLLASYEEERRPISARLLAVGNGTEENGEAPDIFQLRNNYRDRSLSEDFRREPGRVRAGDRAPDAPLHLPEASRLFELIRQADLTVLTFGDDAAARSGIVAAGGARIRLVPVVALPRAPELREVGGVAQVNVDRDSPATAEIVRAIYDVAPGEEVAFLLRPDGYIGLVADSQIGKRLEAYLSRIAASSIPH